MDAIGEVVGEILMIILTVGIWGFFVGVKVQCQECGQKFYHWNRHCPTCGWELR